MSKLASRVKAIFFVIFINFDLLVSFVVKTSEIARIITTLFWVCCWLLGKINYCDKMSLIFDA